ncbi:MAG: dihydrodipicolinate synthase family protein [Planctomycetota bacterium]
MSEQEFLSGPFAAIFTPFNSRGELNVEMLSRIADYQIDNGIRGFFACGSTGEGLLMTTDERIEVVKHLVQHVSGRAKVIAHVGHPSTDVSVKLAQAAARDGADWVSSVTPIYYGTTFEGTLRHYSAIASASELPFMIYSLGGVIDPERDAAFFDIPNVAGLKYTGANFFSVQQLTAKLERPVSLMSGFDEQFVAGQSFGFHGGIGSTYNFAPRFYAEIFRLYHENDVAGAAALQAEINKVTSLMVQYENWSYRKAIMRYIGLDCGWCRAPYAPLSEFEYEDFANQLDQLAVLTRDDAV